MPFARALPTLHNGRVVMRPRSALVRLGVCAALASSVGCADPDGLSSVLGSETSQAAGRHNAGSGAESNDTAGSDASASDSGASDSGEEGGGGSAGGSSDLPPSEGWFEVGQGEDEFVALVDGGEIELVHGGQGLWMFPMPIRGAGFQNPDNPLDWDDPKSPRLSLVFDIEDFETVYGDHFGKVGDYPVSMFDKGDGIYEHIYLPVIAPNDFTDKCSIHGHAAHVSASLAVAGGGAPLTYEVDLVVVVPITIADPCD